MTRPTKSTKPTAPPRTEEFITPSTTDDTSVTDVVTDDEVLPHMLNAIGNATVSPPRASTE